MNSLPIDDFKPQIDRLLKTQASLVITADTGSGKSTRLPLWAAEFGTVLVVQPRRVACSSLAHYLSEQYGSELGQHIGYAIRHYGEYSENSKVLFVTPGIALRWFIENRLSEFKSVMLDEFHERRADMDLLLALLKDHAKHQLVVTSATLNSQQLASYLKADALHIPGRIFDVQVRYRSKEGVTMPSSDRLTERVIETINTAINQHEGDLLVFLPGRSEINRVFAGLKADNVEKVMLHGGVNAEQQREILSEHRQRRVVLATNIAETSVTIPGITVVIDSGLERRTQQRNGRTVLALKAISKASAEQRKGRAGRVQAGHCYRLWGEFAPLLEQTPPEVQREELDDLVLATACVGKPAASLEFLESLPAKSLSAACTRLQAVNAIDDQFIATDYGLKLFPLPLDSFFSHLISRIADPTLKAAAVDLSALLTVANRLIRMPKSELACIEFQRWQQKACDLSTAIALIRQQAPEGYVQDTSILKEARQLAKEVRASLSLPDISSEIDFEHETFISAILEVLPNQLYLRRKKRRQAMGNGYAEVQISDNSRLDEKCEAALVLDQFSMPGRTGVKQTVNMATCLAPVKLQQIIKAGLGTFEYSEPFILDDRLWIKWQRIYAEQVIETGESLAPPERHLEYIVQLILSGKLMFGIAEKLQGDMDAWQLFSRIHPTEQSEKSSAGDLKDWLLDRLERLGVSEFEDLMLIEESDLQFEGIPDWQRQEFDEKFPRRVVLSGLVLSVKYQVAAKRIELEKVSGSRKEDPKRKELPAWSGWRVSYRKASRVIDLK